MFGSGPLAGAAALLMAMAGPLWAGEIRAAKNEKARPAFDILSASIRQDDAALVFTMAVRGQAGSSVPEPTGKLGGAAVWSYVWPTSFDPSVVGFGHKAGILAFAVTSHPDFDDTPLFDEDGDGNPANDGRKWHSHWVVLVPDDACGPGALKVKDIPAGEAPRLPKTWPKLPILIDSPGWHPTIKGESISVRVPFEAGTELKGVKFDGVTAALRVNANIHSPLLCVTDVYKIASGNLSLPEAID